MIGYVARDKDGSLYLYDSLPEYSEGLGGWFGSPDMINITDEFPEFDNLDSFDDPIKVEIELEKI
jgi:hypothetical protein